MMGYEGKSMIELPLEFRSLMWEVRFKEQNLNVVPAEITKGGGATKLKGENQTAYVFRHMERVRGIMIRNRNVPDEE
jgi:hypothetical protein